MQSRPQSTKRKSRWGFFEVLGNNFQKNITLTVQGETGEGIRLEMWIKKKHKIFCISIDLNKLSDK